MKAGGRFRFFVTLTSILAATFLVGAFIYRTTFDTLRQSYQQMLDRSVDQGVFLIQDYFDHQFALLSLYAAHPSVQAGRITDLPEWQQNPTTEIGPRRIAILDESGRGIASNGKRFDAADKRYFQVAREGHPTVEGPFISRIDGTPVVVAAIPIPGHHADAAVLTASIHPSSLRVFLESLRGLSGAELTLSEPGSQVIATTATDRTISGGGMLESSKVFGPASWTLSARVRMADLLQPVRNVLIVIAGLVLLGGGLILVFYLTGLRHRKALDDVREDRTQALRDAYEQIRKLAYHDTVTRLPNRNLVTRRVGEALQAGTDLVVAVIALGRFRSLTTTFGLHFGDLVLRESAARLASFEAMGEGSFLGRLGGSEFVLLIPAQLYGPQTLPALLELFRAPLGRNDLKLQVNVHIGACRLSEAGETAEDVIKSAETALWAARELGPHEAFELDEPSVLRRLRRAQLQKLLPEAWERGEMEVHFQPQIDLSTGEVGGYEALLRWTSPVLGAVVPSDFIPVAEESGAIVPLGFWVLEKGIEFSLRLWEEERPAVVSVNVSPVQFLHHDFFDQVSRRIAASGLPPAWLGLEITESALMEGIEQLRPSLRQIMDSGVKVSLDDFGTGYSSLNYLRELPLDHLKIDKSFIQALEEDEKAFRLVECIIDLAHHLGLIVVAEGIETARQQELLTTVGCDLVQGFRTGRPLPAQEHLDRVLQ